MLREIKGYLFDLGRAVAWVAELLTTETPASVPVQPAAQPGSEEDEAASTSGGASSNVMGLQAAVGLLGGLMGLFVIGVAVWYFLYYRPAMNVPPPKTTSPVPTQGKSTTLQMSV